MSDPRAELAPEVLDALRSACASVRAVVDGELLEAARLRIAMLLGAEAELGARPWGDLSLDRRAALAQWSTADCFDPRSRDALALAEQFTIDVTGVASGPLAAAAGSLGAQVLPYVQSLFLLDVGQRVAIVLGDLFGTVVTSDDWAWGADPVDDPMEAVMDLLAAVGRLGGVDPVTRELVRLRGARLHQCRRCQSVRSVAALRTGIDAAVFDVDDPSVVAPLDDATTAAIALVDATFVGPPSLDPALRDRLVDAFDGAQLVELASFLLRNATNKVAVAFGADEAIVTEGHEYQIIDADGQTVTVDASALA